MKNKLKKSGGVPANRLVIPLIVVLMVLHFFIIVLIIEVNRSDDRLTELTVNAGVYQQTATNLQAGSSVLSETASSYVQMPVTQDGSANVGPLTAYAQELGQNRRGSDVVELFRDYDVSNEARTYIEDAAEESDQMMEIQLHAIALLRSVYPAPPAQALEIIPETELTREEEAMPEEARVAYARQLIMSQEYSQLKRSLSEDIDKCHEIVQKEVSRASAETRQHIALLRTAMWAVIIIIIGTLVGTIILHYRWIIRPLRICSRRISADQAVEQKSIILEMRQMVDAYNTLLNRRNKLEDILRLSAETDALTGMSNRTGFESDVLDLCDEGCPLAVVMLDVNYLKFINDTKGHLAGDNLIRTAADCIRECFGQEDNSNCYRIGGDEFAVLLRVSDKEEVETRISRFELAMEREKISVSYGWAFSGKTDNADFKKMMAEADRRMYDQKKHIHEMNKAEQDDSR